MNKLEFKKMDQRISVGFEFPIPAWYKHFFYETCLAYFHSCSKERRIPHKGLSQEYQKIIELFFEKKPIFLSTGKPEKSIKLKYNFDGQKVAVAFSGGKDCVYLVDKLIKSGKNPNDILCLYIPNLNKSESHYEKIAVEKISNYLGCQFHILDVTNSIKINRSGHNIGIREQLISCLCLPYMIQFGADSLYFGLKSEKSDDDLLFTDRRDVFQILQNRINQDVPQINLIPYGPLEGMTDLEISKCIFQNSPKLLELTSSCYTQINFREKRHDKLQSQFPSMKLYNGCGQCQKCMIINGAIAIFQESSTDKKRFVSFYKKRMEEKFMDNDDITQAYKEMT